MIIPLRDVFSRHHFAFPKLLAYRVLLVLSYQIMMVAIGWHIYELTRDLLSLGLIGLVEVIPYFSCALFAGHAIDHYCTRRFFAMLSALVLSLSAFMLLAIAYHWLPNQSAWIYVAVAITGIARAFIAPSYNTLLTLIMPRKMLSKVAGIGAVAFQAGLIVGPAISGFIIGFADKHVAYVLSAILALGASLAILSLKVSETRENDKTPVFTSIAEGLRFVRSTQILLGAQILDMFAVLFGGVVAMLPAFVQDVYHLGPEGLGILRTAPAVGAILTGMWLSRHPIRAHSGRWLLFAVAGFGVCMIAFGLSSQFWFGVVALAVSGAFDSVSVVLRQTIMLLTTPDNMRGRVSAINGIFIGSSNELGAFESGVTARLMGLIPSVIFGGCMTIGVVAATAKWAPKLRDLEIHELEQEQKK